MADASAVRLRRARTLVAAAFSGSIALAALLLLAGPVAAQFDPPIGQPLLIVPGYAPTNCRLQPRIFESLKYGATTVCRVSMKYRPGALECAQFLDQICGTFTTTGQWIEGYTTVTTNFLPCPGGPPPPMCPQIGAGGLRRGLRYR